MHELNTTTWQVRPLEHDADVYGVYDEQGRLLGSGSRQACQHFLAVLRHPQPSGEYTAEAVTDSFEQWRAR